MKNKKMGFGTKAIHAGVIPDPSTGAIMTPIFQTSTYVQPKLGQDLRYQYSRSLNPTRKALEDNLAALENGKYGYVFGSGMAAADCAIKLLQPGDEVIATNDIYGGSYRMFTQIYADFGIKFHFVAMNNPRNIKKYINKNTKMIWVETPTNPLLNIIDIEGIAKIAKKKGIQTVVDNTFATPYLQNPLDLGADIVHHSCTKYLGGHSDVVMGALITNCKKTAERIAFIQKSCGAVIGPMDCFLMLRGIKTLHLRMEQHCKTAKKVAKFLKKHPKVGQVFHPSLKEHKNHEVAKRQMKDFGGMLSFELKDDSIEAATKIVESTKLFALAESLGGVESLIGHPATMTHASIPREERMKIGLNDSLIRLSIGIEDAKDIISDLKQAIG